LWQSLMSVTICPYLGVWSMSHQCRRIHLARALLGCVMWCVYVGGRDMWCMVNVCTWCVSIVCMWCVCISSCRCSDYWWLLAWLLDRFSFITHSDMSVPSHRWLLRTKTRVTMLYSSPRKPVLTMRWIKHSPSKSLHELRGRGYRVLCVCTPLYDISVCTPTLTCYSHVHMCSTHIHMPTSPCTCTYPHKCTLLQIIQFPNGIQSECDSEHNRCQRSGPILVHRSTPLTLAEDMAVDTL